MADSNHDMAGNDNHAGATCSIFSVVALELTDFFAPTYRVAREQLLGAVADTGAFVASHEHPGPSSDEQPLFTDIVRLGPEGARRILLIISGTHGVEGFAGSAIQIAALRHAHAVGLPDDTALLLIHALNPYGFSWYRRVDEHNVDVNRNLVDLASANADNPEYELLHVLLCPEKWDDMAQRRGAQALQDYQARHGRAALENALARGQHRHQDGLFFRGRSPSWSIQLLRSVFSALSGSAQRVTLLDVHTGLGTYGGCQLICGIDEASPRVAAVRCWLGDAALFFGPTSGFAQMPGAIDSGSEAALPGVEVTPVTVEFGTLPALEVLQALRADNWLHGACIRPNPDDPIKRDMRRAFYPDDADWRELVLLRGRQVIARALHGLSA
jgi:hypothetical protein